MNKKERQHFLIDLINNVKKDILKENYKYPNSWDGIELRERVKDVYSRVVWLRFSKERDKMFKKRLKDYKNYCLFEGLL